MKFKLCLARSILLMALILASGCAYTFKMSAPAVAVGSNLRINQSFKDLSNGSQIYFQNGTNRPSEQLDKWSTYCVLYVYSDQHEAEYITSVEPGDFLVSSASNRREVVDNQYGPNSPEILLAAVEWDRYDRPSFILYRTELRLYSAEQPDVKSLSCYQKASTYGNYHPKLEQIKLALGDVIQITH